MIPAFFCAIRIELDHAELRQHRRDALDAQFGGFLHDEVHPFAAGNTLSAPEGGLELSSIGRFPVIQECFEIHQFVEEAIKDFEYILEISSNQEFINHAKEELKKLNEQ